MVNKNITNIFLTFSSFVKVLWSSGLTKCSLMTKKKKKDQMFINGFTPRSMGFIFQRRRIMQNIRGNAYEKSSARRKEYC